MPTLCYDFDDSSVECPGEHPSVSSDFNPEWLHVVQTVDRNTDTVTVRNDRFHKLDSFEKECLFAFYQDDGNVDDFETRRLRGREVARGTVSGKRRRLVFKEEPAAEDVLALCNRCMSSVGVFGTRCERWMCKTDTPLAATARRRVVAAVHTQPLIAVPRTP